MLSAVPYGQESGSLGCFSGRATLGDAGRWAMGDAALVLLTAAPLLAGERKALLSLPMEMDMVAYCHNSVGVLNS